MIHAIHMPPKGMSNLTCIYVEQSCGMIHRGGNHEIPSIMKCYCPNWLNMVLKCMCACCVDEIPNLDSAISR